MRDKDQRGLIVYFNDGSSLSLQFPKQTEDEAAARLKLENVLEKRQMIFEVDGRLYVIPFESIKYVRVFPAPASVAGHTLITGASIS